MNDGPLKTVFLDFDTVSDGDLDTAALRAASDQLILLDFGGPEEVAARIRDADVVLLNKTELSRELLSGATALRLVALAGTGTNHIDLGAARERGIAVCNVRGYCTASVVQQVWALILSLTQHVPQFSRLGRSSGWRAVGPDVFSSLAIRELQGRTFGVVGWGELGRGAARIAEAFGMRVAIAERPGRVASLVNAASPGSAAARVPLDALLAAADIVSLHCPLTAETRGLIGARELALMKRDALLINSARGGLIDGHALAAALQAGRLAGAGIDVLEREPPQDDPLLEKDVPNLIVTPHVAWAAREARQRCIDEMAANIRDFRAGGRRGRVD